MASAILARKVKRYREWLFSKYGRNNRIPKTVIGAEYRYKRQVDHSGPCPNSIATKLKLELLKIAPLGTKGIDNYVGCCCEVRSSNKIMITDNRINITDIDFTDALRSKTGQVRKRCANCKAVFG